MIKKTKKPLTLQETIDIVSSKVDGVKHGMFEMDGAHIYNRLTIPVGTDRYDTREPIAKTIGTIWLETDHIHLIDENATEQTALNQSDIVTPTDGATSSVASSDWAYDHENGSNPHPIVCNADEVVCNLNEVVYNV